MNLLDHIKGLASSAETDFGRAKRAWMKTGFGVRGFWFKGEGRAQGFGLRKRVRGFWSGERVRHRCTCALKVKVQVHLIAQRQSDEECRLGRRETTWMEKGLA